jgi:hypothetical protein
MNETPLPQPLEDFLQTPPSAELSAGLQEAMLAKTMVLLPKRHRRWVATSMVAASVAVAFCAGYLIGRGHEAEFAELDRQVAIELVRSPPSKEPTPIVPEKPKPPVVAAKPLTALEVEWQAFDAMDEKERAHLYFQAGDLYFGRERDVSGATRCYHQALTFCDSRQLEFDPNDNWLVMALKRDQHKEK